LPIKAKKQKTIETLMHPHRDVPFFENGVCDLVRERTDGRKDPYYLGPDSLMLKKSKYIGG